jgi:predicted Zn finger-like uncharacterized protein
MIVVCPACQARFQYDERRFGTARGKRFKCPKCAHVFEVLNPALTAPVPEATLSRPVPPVPDEPTPAQLPPPVQQTTARRDRESLLAAAGLASRPSLKISLAFLSGPQASTVQVLERPTITIGRDEGDVITRDPETSRQHARLDLRADGTVWLTDLNSTNGTVVDGARITEPTQIQSQQEFTCGNSTFMLLIRNTNEFPLN